ncbi:MAG: 4Fe-4S dicluster domain-containing protein [Planctomycetota bacterium]|jgi:MauM/NapG family ferredoxin protein
MNRRQLLLRGAAGALGVGALLGTLHATKSGPPVLLTPEMKRRGLLRPPGSRTDEAEFLAHCIRCQRCSQVCETDAIRLFGPGGGRHEGTPFIVAEESACNLCLECGRACPTGAIEELTGKAQARMGTAVVDEQLCVSHNGTGICGACFTVCPLRGKAITQGRRNRPTVHKDVCVGCGLCEEACIVDHDKAIRVFTERTEWARKGGNL